MRGGFQTAEGHRSHAPHSADHGIDSARTQCLFRGPKCFRSIPNLDKNQLSQRKAQVFQGRPMHFSRGIDHQPPTPRADLFSEGRNGQFSFPASFLKGDPFADLPLAEAHGQPGDFLLRPDLPGCDRGKKGSRAKALLQSLTKVKQSCRRSHGPTLSGLTSLILYKCTLFCKGRSFFCRAIFQGTFPKFAVRPGNGFSHRPGPVRVLGGRWIFRGCQRKFELGWDAKSQRKRKKMIDFYELNEGKNKPKNND